MKTTSPAEKPTGAGGYKFDTERYFWVIEAFNNKNGAHTDLFGAHHLGHVLSSPEETSYGGVGVTARRHSFDQADPIAADDDLLEQHRCAWPPSMFEDTKAKPCSKIDDMDCRRVDTAFRMPRRGTLRSARR